MKNTQNSLNRQAYKYIAVISLSLIFIATPTYASSKNTVLISQLHKASQNIEKFSNYKLINESLYKQIRPRANITNHQLSKIQIDEKVRKYIALKYAPALVGNYSHLYALLHSSKKEFSNCNHITPINPNEDILKSLCFIKHKGSIKVQYMTNAYSKGWAKSAGFVFSTIEGKLQLIGIELHLKPGTKAYVEGI